MVPEIATLRLRLRGFTAEAAAEHVRFYSDPDITRHLAGGPIPPERAGARSARAREVFAQHWRDHGHLATC
jgi:hypothetical protein